MKEDYIKAVKAMVFAQSFVEAIEDFEGSAHYKQKVKMRGKAFTKEVDCFLDTVYRDGGSPNEMIELIEMCQQAIDKVIDEKLEVV